MSATPAKRLGFNTAIWLVAIPVSLWIAATPLLQNAWAVKTWHQIPCWLGPQGRFFYQAADGKKFLSTRTNFWTYPYHTEPVVRDLLSSDHSPNNTCWVSPTDPLSSVLRLDAWQDLSGGTSRFATAALLLAGAAFVTIILKKRPRSKHA